MVHMLCKNRSVELQDNVVSKQLTLYDQEKTDQYVCGLQSVNCLDKQSSFSIAPAVQYALLPVKELKWS